MRVTALHKKLLRQLVTLRAQIVTIALVVAGGVMCFVSLRGTAASLDWARATYYDRYRFADVFAHAERVPEHLARELEAMPGVAVVETRIYEEVTVPVEGMDRPAYARLLSLPASGQPATNALHVVEGDLPVRGRGRDDDVAVLASFAEAHALHPGNALPAVVGGKLRRLHVVAIVESPEFVYAIRPVALVDDPQRYAVLWMQRSVLASAFRLDGAFNDVSIRLQPGASAAAVIAAVDRLLLPYGCDGAFGRDRQLSNRILTSELSQLDSIAGMVPVVFLGVSAFLIHVVLRRLIAIERAEIAALKAIGYTNVEIARHYLGLVAVVLAPGGALGVVAGVALGRRVTDLYTAYFRFPVLAFRASTSLVVFALAVSAGAAAFGALLAVRAAARLPPAEAMRPPAPARYRRGLVERAGLAALVGPAGLIALRDLARRPIRTALSSVGIAGAVALVVLGHFGVDSLDVYLEETFSREHRQDLAVAFARPVDPAVVGELGRMPGVVIAEGVRDVPVRARHEQRARDAVLVGLPRAAVLRQLVARDTGRLVEVPDDGVVVSKALGDVLGLAVGDRLALEVREGDRPTVRPAVAGFVDDAVGLSVYAREAVVAALEHDEGAVSSVLLRVAPERRAAVEARLRRSPYVLDVSDAREELTRMRDLNGSIMDVWTAISVTLAASVIFGVVYNNARIALASKERELATLRVIGMTRREVSGIAIAQIAAELVLGIPVGLVLGRLWGELFMSNVDKETFRFSVVVAPRTYALAAGVALLAGAASALWVRRNVDRLDLIGVLKTRE